MFAFIISHMDELLIAISSIIAGASALAALTPTQKDDLFLMKIKKTIDLMALNIGHAKPAGA